MSKTEQVTARLPRDLLEVVESVAVDRAAAGFECCEECPGGLGPRSRGPSRDDGARARPELGTDSGEPSVVASCYT